MISQIDTHLGVIGMYKKIVVVCTFDVENVLLISLKSSTINSTLPIFRIFSSVPRNSHLDDIKKSCASGNFVDYSNF